jgi:hypothetical protein
MLGSTHHQRELQNSSYIPNNGDVRADGGGTYTSNSLVPSLQDYERVFGPSARDIKDDPQRSKRHQRWHLPDVLKGPNPWMTDRIDGLISDANKSPFTTIILPYKYIENVDAKIKWNVFNFDEALASRVPYEAPARVLTQTKRSFSGYTVRQGLAISMEHNFMMSEAGIRNFENQLLQMVGSIQQTNDLDVHVALITAPSYAKTMREKYFNSGKTQHQEIREYVDLFGMVQKNPNAMDILIEEARNTFEQWNSKAPDFLLVNAKLTFQMTMIPEKTQYLTQGYDGVQRLKDGPNLPSYRGLKIINTRSFSLETNAQPRDLLRRRVRVAEYYRITYDAHVDKKLFQLYDESKDRWFSFTYDDCLKWCRLPVDGPMGIHHAMIDGKLFSNEIIRGDPYSQVMTSVERSLILIYHPEALDAGGAVVPATFSNDGEGYVALFQDNIDDGKYTNNTTEVIISKPEVTKSIVDIMKQCYITDSFAKTLLTRIREANKLKIEGSIPGNISILNNGSNNLAYFNSITTIMAYQFTDNAFERNGIQSVFPRIQGMETKIGQEFRHLISSGTIFDMKTFLKQVENIIKDVVASGEEIKNVDLGERFGKHPDSFNIKIKTRFDKSTMREFCANYRDDDIVTTLLWTLFKKLFTEKDRYFMHFKDNDAVTRAIYEPADAHHAKMFDIDFVYKKSSMFYQIADTGYNKEMEIVIIRPNIEHNMLGAVIGRGGLEDLGATLWGQTELSCFDDGMHGIWGMSYKYNERAMVFNEKSLIRLWDIAYDGYNGGKDDTYVDFTDIDSVRNYKQKACERNEPYTGPSMIVMGFPVDQTHRLWKRNWPNPIAWDTINPNHYCIDPEIQNKFKSEHEHCVFADELYKSRWAEYREHIIDATLQDNTNKTPGYAAHENETSTCALAFQGSMRILNAENNQLIEEITGSGHHGKDYVGVSTARAGKGMYHGMSKGVAAHIVP